MSRLETNFAIIAAGRGVDVCRYSFLSDLTNPSIPSVCQTLLHFQSLYTYAYDAVKTKAKQIARIAAETVDESTFGFGYSFSGSLGIVFTFDNKKVTLFESYMDETMNAVFALAQSTTQQDVALQAKVLGAPTVKAARQWASDHVQCGLGVDVQSVKGDAVKESLRLEVRDLIVLVDAMDNTSDTRVEPIEVEGVLSGGESSNRHLFHLVLDDGTDIRGSFTDAISDEHPAAWPKHYRAFLQKTTKEFYTGEKPDAATYFLTRLEPL